MKEYYKIGEISKIYEIGRDSLMYYEELGILKPHRDTNGYRMYSISDIWKLNLIKELRQLDFPMKKIKDYLDNRSIESTKGILEKEISLIDEQIEKLKEYKCDIKSRVSSIDSVVKDTTINKIDKVYIKERKALKLSANIKRDEEVDFLIQKLQKEYEHRFNILGSNNIGATYCEEKFFSNIYNEFKSVFCLLSDEEEIFNIKIKSGNYITLSYRGSYKNNHIHINSMFDYMDKHSYILDGDIIEIYKIDIHETSNVEEFITEIQIPIR